MKVMNKVLKSRIFSFILGAVIFGGIVGVSAYSILASDIEYTPQDATWEVDNVSDALNELYIKSSISKTEVIVSKNQWVETITFTPSPEYKYYILTNLIWYSQKKIYSDCINYIDISNVENATYFNVGSAGRNSDVASGATRSFLIIPTGTENVTINLNYGADSASVYGIK